MARIWQQSLFTWQDVEELGDLERLKLVLDTLPDEALMQALERRRGHGRNDYSVRAVWNALLALVVYQHPSVESLRRELMRNAQLRDLCGFEPGRAAHIVPPSRVFSNMLTSLYAHEDMIEAMFNSLVKDLGEVLPGLGAVLALDSKAVASCGRKPKSAVAPDGRRDTDADYGVKTYTSETKDGETLRRKVAWFGYKMHLLVDARYELPVAYTVTNASRADISVGRDLIDAYADDHPGLMAGCDVLTADRAYDDTTLITTLFDTYAVKPVIGIRNQWQDGEATRLVQGTENVVYTYDGQVRCHCMKTGTERRMAYAGFERSRGTLKFRCPAMHYGCACRSLGECPVGRAIRIRLDEDRRVFVPLHRDSYRYADAYNARTAVERVNSRLDVSFGFEHHYIRGLAKMRVRAGVALMVMLAMALGRARQNRLDKLRSLVQAA